MEFYRLNRLYNKNLTFYEASETIDTLLYYFYPILILFGIGISLINIITLTNNIYITSKTYLLSESISVFLFQLISAIIFITNYYEQILFDNIYLYTYKTTYLEIKIYLHYFYNTFLYLIVWLLILGTLDYCVISIIQPKNDDDDEDEDEEEEDEDTGYPPIQYQHDEDDDDHDALSHQDNEFIDSIKRAATPNDSTIAPTSNKTKLFRIERIYFKKETCRKLIIFLFLFALLFTLPQLFAYQVKEHKLLVNKKTLLKYNDNERLMNKLATVNINNNNNKNNHNKQSSRHHQNYQQQQQQLSQINYRKLSVHANNAIASFTVINNRNGSIKKETLVNSQVNYKISSIKHEYCNIINNDYNEFKPNDDELSSRMKLLLNRQNSLMSNVTVTCIADGSLHQSLIYNTLYFWLGQTLLIWMPIFIWLVLNATFLHTIRNRQSFFNIESKLVKRYSKENLKRKFSASTITEIIKFQTNVYKERFEMTKLHLISLYLYLLLVLPYTLLRLVLALYIKESVKLNLDFYIIYKSSLILFHFYFILKFFLFLSFSKRYRSSLLKSFACQKCIFTCCCCCICSCCFISKRKQQEIINSNSRRRLSKTGTSCLKNIFCFFCLNCCLSKYLSKCVTNDDSSNNSNNIDTEFEEDRPPTNFNSNFHEFSKPANYN